MRHYSLIALNIFLVAIFVAIARKRNLLAFLSGGKWWLTWFSVGIITFMDEFTSIFYAPSEAHRFIREKAIFFLIFTALFIHYFSTRMVEIAQILEKNGIRGGGVYSFSYLVLGPTVSFIAIASIFVDYVLTACISAVSAVANGTTFLSISPWALDILPFLVVWFIAGLNIIGVRENARFTFMIFTAAIFVVANLIACGFFEFSSVNLQAIKVSFNSVFDDLTGGSVYHALYAVTIGMGGSILAYSGIESVVQTAGLVKGWRDIGKAYVFLALTVGLITPLVSTLALSSPIDFGSHEGDLIAYYGRIVGGKWLGLAVACLGSVTLMMAVNTAFVASSELLERVAHRYGIGWIIKTNGRGSLYRLHILSAVFFSVILAITGGAQKLLAEMYAIGLLASFCINTGCLLIYRYFRGTTEIKEYSTTRFGTLLMWVVFVSCFVYLALHKPYGTLLWAATVVVCIVVGTEIARKRAPEIKEIEKTDFPMELITRIAGCDEQTIHIYFKRPGEKEVVHKPNAFFVTFFSPRVGIPPKLGENHFRFPILRTQGVYHSILAILYTLRADLPEKKIVVHFGWPMSSWLDRLATGLFTFYIMRLPKIFPEFRFVIEHGKVE
jgi:amino acid transporter